MSILNCRVEKRISLIIFEKIQTLIHFKKFDLKRILRKFPYFEIRKSVFYQFIENKNHLSEHFYVFRVRVS